MKKQQIWSFIYLLATYVQTSYQISSPDSPTYRAAVVEFASEYVPNDSQQTLKKNSDGYVTFIEKARQQNVDIIVFPEDGITSLHLPGRNKLDPWTTLIPAPSENYNPCIQNTIPVSDTLKKLSCAARNNTIYLVVNIAEKLPCRETQCPMDKVFYYNTNVVFDRTGKIIARYRKTHLFWEPGFNTTANPEIVVFDTDFGVKFGTFICFDILFQQPSTNLTRDLQVRDIVFPTAWFSETPFLTALEIQFAWSHAEDVNFLVAGYNKPDNGNAGSGIYLGRDGIAKAVLPLVKQEQMLVADVQKKLKKTPSHTDHVHTQSHILDHGSTHAHDIHKRQTLNELKLLHDDYRAFETVPFQNSITKDVCHGKFCCSFRIKMTTTNSPSLYRMVAFRGIRSFANITNAGIDVCAVIQCKSDSLTSCGSVENSETTFKTIDIAGTFGDYKNSIIMPVTLNSSLFPIDKFTFEEHKHDEHVHVNMGLTQAQRNMATFGIYARVFSRDASPNSTSTVIPNMLPLAILFVFVLRLFI